MGRDHAGGRRQALLECAEVRMCALAQASSVRGNPFQRYQLIRVPHARDGPQQDGVNPTEYHRARGDAQSQRDHGHNRETRGGAQNSPGKTQIPQNVSHVVPFGASRSDSRAKGQSSLAWNPKAATLSGQAPPPLASAADKRLM